MVLDRLSALFSAFCCPPLLFPPFRAYWTLGSSECCQNLWLKGISLLFGLVEAWRGKASLPDSKSEGTYTLAADHPSLLPEAQIMWLLLRPWAEASSVGEDLLFVFCPVSHFIFLHPLSPIAVLPKRPLCLSPSSYIPILFYQDKSV